MSYYNMMITPTTETPLHAHIISDYEPNFDNMVKLMELDESFIQTDQDNHKFVAFKIVDGGTDMLRPSQLNWKWHSEDTTYADADCFIPVSKLIEYTDWSDLSIPVADLEEYIESYQKHLVQYPVLFIVP